jgi:hypothetical protein
MFFVAALIPMIVGSIYYHPKVLGTTWMNSNGFTEESMKGANMGIILGVSYLLSIMLSLALSSLVIHQGNVFQVMMPEVAVSGSTAQQQFNDLMAQYGNNFRDFKHGALHGGISALFIALPIIGINALFERRGWKYALIHTGYWFVTMLLMGGLLCATLEYGPAV